MTDRISKQKRSYLMSRIRYKDTNPEIAVRRQLHKMGYRFRLHCRELPGRPDIIMKKYGLAIFVNGCFWHHHDGCSDGSIPKTNTEFWVNKINRNIERDKVNLAKLSSMGWKVAVLWECEINGAKSNLSDFLKNKLFL